MLRMGTIVALTIIVIIAGYSGIAFAQSNHPSPSDATPSTAQPAPTQPVSVSNEVMLGLVEHKTMPVYPVEAMKKGIQGDVIFKIEVDETGKITASVPGEVDPLLIAASKDALRTFRFRPYLVNGTPTRVRTQLGFHFSVQKTDDGANGHVECMASIPNRP
jgi:outer membrane biosynthesis protein TonB